MARILYWLLKFLKKRADVPGGKVGDRGGGGGNRLLNVTGWETRSKCRVALSTELQVGHFICYLVLVQPRQTGMTEKC